MGILKRKFLYCALTCSLLGILLGGCSIQPTPVDHETQLSNTKFALDETLKPSVLMNRRVTISEAVARVMKFNLDYRISRMKIMLEAGNLKLAYMEMLPFVGVDMNYSFRNNEQVQNLVNNGQLEEGQQSFTPKRLLDIQAGIKWNLLDFGLSYVRAQQQGSRVLIAQEQKRKVTQKLFQDAISAYWKAWAAQEISPKIQLLKRKVKLALKRSRQIISDRTRSTQHELKYQHALLKTMRRMNLLQLQVSNAKATLAQLMSVKPGAKFRLVSPGVLIKKLPKVKPAFRKMDIVAMVNRPELREATYQTKIAKKGITAAILEMLPGISFEYGYNYTNNKFMLNQEWLSGAVATSLNLIQSIIRGPTAIRTAYRAHDFENLKLVAATLTVLTQLRVSYANYLIRKDDYYYASQQADVAQRLFNHSLNLEKAKAGNRQLTIQNGVESLNADFEAAIAHAKAYDALEMLYVSAGLDSMPDNIYQLPLKQIHSIVRATLLAKSIGSFNKMIDQEYQSILPSLRAVKQKRKAEKALKNKANKK